MSTKLSRPKPVSAETKTLTADSESDPFTISSIATIKKCIVKPECGDLQFEGFQFTGDQYKLISQWIEEKEPLVIKIEPAQKQLNY